MTSRRRLTPEERKQRMDAAHAQLNEAIENLLTDAGWQAMIQARAWLRRYSFHNLMMILIQRTDATDVRPLSEWNELGRRVIKGEHAIKIWAPRFRRLTDDEIAAHISEYGVRPPAKVLAGYILVNVFDVAQTQGEPLPVRTLTNIAPELLVGNAPAKLWDQISTRITAKGFTLHRGDCGGANGQTNYVARTVTVREDVDDAQAVKTLIHELAHILCDHETRPLTRNAREVEAESVACIVAAAAGLDSLPYSVPYVAGWAKDMETVARSAEKVLEVADDIIAGLEVAAVATLSDCAA